MSRESWDAERKRLRDDVAYQWADAFKQYGRAGELRQFRDQDRARRTLDELEAQGARLKDLDAWINYLRDHEPARFRSMINQHGQPS